MHSQSPKIAADGTEPLQFSLRGILLVLTLCAVAFAILAPIVQAQTYEQRVALAIGYLVLVLVITFAAFLLRLKSATVLKQAGERVYVTGKTPMTWSQWVIILMGILLVFFAWPFIAVKGLNILPVVAQNVLVSVIFLAAIFDNRRLDLRQNGIVFMRIHYVPWAKIKSYRWTGERSEKLVLKHAPFGSSTLKVPAADREAVERILAEQVARRNEKPFAAIM